MNLFFKSYIEVYEYLFRIICNKYINQKRNSLVTVAMSDYKITDFLRFWFTRARRLIQLSFDRISICSYEWIINNVAYDWETCIRIICLNPDEYLLLLYGNNCYCYTKMIAYGIIDSFPLNN